MNLLGGSRVYLSGGMQYVTDGQTWREKAKARLRPLGITCFDPYFKPFLHSFPEDNKTRAHLAASMNEGRYRWVHKRMKEVRNEDLRICDISDFALIVINPKVPSWGTAEELFEMNSQKKPVFVVIEQGRRFTPLWLMGTLPPHYFYDSLEKALLMIERINSGQKKIDSSRWRLLKDEYRCVAKA